MDFATLKAYMTTTSIKENVNTTVDCMQKRLSMYRLDRQTSRSARLTQFRKIPENLSVCNTPQQIRNDPQLDVSNTKPLRNTNKLFEDRQKLRQKRLREFKEKKEKAKRDEANKKPMFKVTHASLENYDLGKLYNNLSNTGPYKFTTLVTRASKHNLSKQLPEAISIMDSSQKNNTPINSYKLRSKQILTETNPLVYNKAKKQVVHSKGTLHYSVLSSDSCITKSKVKIITAEKLQINCILPSNLSETIQDINKSLTKASVKITKEEQMIVDNNFISNASKKSKECSHVTQGKKNDSNMREETEKMLKSSLIMKNRHANISKSEISSRATSNTPKKSTEVARRLLENPTKVRNNISSTLKSPRILRRSKSQNISTEYFSNKGVKEISTGTLCKNNYKSKSEELLAKKATSFETSGLPKVLVKNCLKLKDTNLDVPSNKQKSNTILKSKLKKEFIEKKAKAEIFNPSNTPKGLNKTTSKAKDSILTPKARTNLEQLKSEEYLDASHSNLHETPSKIQKNIKNPFKPKINNSLSSLKEQKTKISRNSSSKFKEPISERIAMFESSLQAPEIKYRTRSNSANTPSKDKFDIDINRDIIQSKIALGVRKSTPAKLPADNTKLKDVLDNNIVNNIENNINEGNADYEQGSFTKTPEHNNAGGNPEENCVYISPFVTISRGKNSARKEYVQRMGSGGTFNSPGLQQSTNIKTAAEYFTLLLDKETNKINKNCEYWNTFKNDNNLPEEAIDMIDVAIGQGNLLQNKKMQSFRNLIEYSLEEQMEKPVTCMDLHGYWDVLHIQIDNVSARFETLSKMRDNNWKEILPEKPKKNALKKKGKALTNTKRSNALQDAIKSARLRAKTLSNEVSIKTPKYEIKPTKHSGTLKCISNLNYTPRNSLISPKSGSPHIMMQVSQVAKSVDRIGSEAVHSAKSILKKRQEFKAIGRKPKVVLFDVTDDAVEDNPAIQENILSEKEAPIVRRSIRLQLQNLFM